MLGTIRRDAVHLLDVNWYLKSLQMAFDPHRHDVMYRSVHEP